VRAVRITAVSSAKATGSSADLGQRVVNGQYFVGGDQCANGRQFIHPVQMAKAVFAASAAVAPHQRHDVKKIITILALCAISLGAGAGRHIRSGVERVGRVG
jgi:hypothetical protein